MIDQAAELCSEWIYLAGLASWRALPVFLVVASLSLLLRRHVPARAVCLLWLLVIARFLMPVSVGSQVAMSNWIDRSVVALTSDSSATDANKDEFDTFTFVLDNGESVTMALLPPEATTEEQAAANAKAQRLAEVESNRRPAAVVPQRGMTESFLESLEPLLIAFAWSVLLGLPALTVLLLLRGFLSHVHFAWRLRRLPTIADRDTVDCLLRVCDDLGVGRRPAIKEVPSLQAPAMFGLFRTTVCLPTDWQSVLTIEQLNWVFRHEAAHVKGRDGLILFAANVAKSLNCFNPLAWIAFSKLQHHLERAADEAATRHMDPAQVRQYGELLLQFASRQSPERDHAAVGLLAMAAPKNLSYRIAALTSQRHRVSWTMRIGLLLIVVAIAGTGLTDAKRPDEPKTLPRPVPNLEVALPSSWRPIGLQTALAPDEGKRRMASFDVSGAIAKAKTLQPNTDAESFVRYYFFNAYQETPESSPPPNIENGVVCYRCTETQEEMIRQILAAFERSGLWQISTEIRMIETDVKYFNQFDWHQSDPTIRCQRLPQPPSLMGRLHWQDASVFDTSSASLDQTGLTRYQQSTSAPIRAIKIGRLESEILVQQVQRELRSNVLQTPKVTLFNGQNASVSDTMQRPFVTDVFWKPGEQEDTLQPRISVVDEGWRMHLRPTVTEDQDVNLQLVLHHSRIEGVKLAALPSNGHTRPGEQVTVQVPTIQSETIAATSTLGKDDVLLVYSPKPYSTGEQPSDEQGKGQVFMIRVDLIPDHSILSDFVRPNPGQ